MSVFLLSVKGQIERIAYPDVPEIFVKFQYVYGDDWIVTTGIEEGITQISKRYDPQNDFVFNFPLDVTFKSTNPRGWPQLIFCAYGRDGRGQEVIRGYGVTHVPLSMGSGIEKVVGLFVPEASNLASGFSNWVSGRKPELNDPRMLARSRGREVLKTSSQGCLHLKFDIISKDMRRMDYVSSTKEPPPITAPLPLASVVSAVRRTSTRPDENITELQEGIRNVTISNRRRPSPRSERGPTDIEHGAEARSRAQPRTSGPDEEAVLEEIAVIKLSESDVEDDEEQAAVRVDEQITRIRRLSRADQEPAESEA